MPGSSLYDTAVVLFTRDLRVHDHPALWRACTVARTVIPLFVVDPWFASHAPASGNRAAFLAESVADLRTSLRARSGDLFIRAGDTVRATVDMIDHVGADVVMMSEDVSAWAGTRHDRLVRACAARECRVEVYPGTAVVPAGELAPAGKDHYAVFTPYWRRWRSTPWRDVLPAPRRVRVPTPLAPGRLPSPTAHGRPLSPGRQVGGEAAGRAFWSQWSARHLADYGEAHDDLPGERTSRMSAYLHFGCVSALELAHAADAHEPFTRQLCWRDFHHQVVAARPDSPTRDYRPRGHRWRQDPAAVAAWRCARTGVPIVDAAMRQLLQEGFVHNRARMLAASYLVKDLGLDWRVGAAHFTDWLTDADLANNTGNWQWIAGTGNDTRPNRRFNLIRQAHRFDPDGTYVRRYVPELAGVTASHVHEPWRLSVVERQRLDYPAPLHLGSSRGG